MDPIRTVPFDPTKKAFSLWQEFRKFAFKGNVIDLAVAVIVGTAFGKIIDSLVKDIIMPLISMVIPAEQSYLGWKLGDGDKAVLYGKFLGEVINFLIVAAALFFFAVKFLGWVMRARKEEVAPPPPALTKDQELLIEIRDLLRQRPAGAES
jgi:large conductance mechanosensitive channel